MDQKTHEGMSTGTVTLPGRPGQPVHVGVWFRLLRALIDELSTPISTVRASSRDDLNRIWQASGHPPRAGLSVWRAYEKLGWPRQQAMLEAAATALHLAETGAITARGSLGHLLAVQPHRPAGSGSPRYAQPADPADPWKQAMDAMNEAVEQAQDDPQTARQLLDLLTLGCRTPASFTSSRQMLIAAGVPGRHLPTGWEEPPPPRGVLS